MKSFWHTVTAFGVILLATVALTQAVYAQDDDASYTIATDDTLQINVFNEPDLSIDEVRIGASGTVAMPLIGQVAVSGLTIEQIEQRLTELYLDGFLKQPQINVSIVEYRPFYMNGEVEAPGSFPYRRGLTIEKAIALAGGFTKRAARDKIQRKQENSNTSQTVSLQDKVKPGDVITVNESFF